LNVTGICNSTTTPLVNVTLNYNTISTVNSTTITNGTPFDFNQSVANDGQYYYNLTCYSTDTLSNTSETRVLRVDTTPPSYGQNYDDAGSVTYEGAVINVYVYWTDAGVGLDSAVFRTNQTGAWTNATTCAFAGNTAGWCNTTINTSGNAWQTICWNEYANDTLARLNASMPETHCFYVTANKPPQITLNQPANNTAYNETMVNGVFNFTAVDDQNTTMECSIYLDSILNQTNSSTLNNTLTEFLINGITSGSHSWLVNCSDGELNSISEVRTFSVAGLTPTPTQGGGGGGIPCTNNSQCASGEYCNGNVCVACSCGSDGICRVCCTEIEQNDPDCETPTPSPIIIPTETPTPTPIETPTVTLTTSLTPSFSPTPLVTLTVTPTLKPVITPKTEEKDLENLLNKASSLLSEAQTLGLNTDEERKAYEKAKQEFAANRFEQAWSYGITVVNSLEPRVTRAKTISLICVTSFIIAIILLISSLYFTWKRKRELAWQRKLEKTLSR